MNLADNNLFDMNKISSTLVRLIAGTCIDLLLIFNCHSALADNSGKLNIALPDLGEPSFLSNSFDYNINNVGGKASYKTTILNSKLSINPGYNMYSGVNLGATAGTKISDKLAFGFVPTIESNRRELLFNTGVDLEDNQRLIYSVSQLHQKSNFSIPGINEKYSSQLSHAVSYKYLIPSASHSSLDFDAYVSDLEAQKLRFGDTSTATNLTQAQGKMDGLRGQLSINPTTDSNLKFALRRERLKFLTNPDYSTQYLANVEWSKNLNSNLYFNAGYDLQDSQESYKLGLVQLMSKRRERVGLNLMTIRNENNIPNDNLVQITYSYKFGGLFSSPLNPASNPSNNFGRLNALSEKVTTRSSFLPVNIPTY